MNLPELCIRRPVMTTLLMAAFMIFGIAGYRQLPVSALPKVDFPTISVTTKLPGASAEIMGATVSTQLEKQFSTIAGISSMTSTSVLGATQVILQFDLDRDIDGAALDVQSALSTAQRHLPPQLPEQPSFKKINPAEQPVIFLSFNSDTLPLSTVDDYAENTVSQRLSTLPGVSQVQVFGQQQYAVRVQVDPEAMAAHNIDIKQVQTAIANATSNAPIGALEGAEREMTLNASGLPQRASDYNRLIVAYRDGAPVRIQDIGTPIDSVTNKLAAAWYNGKRSIVLAVQRQPGANTVEVVDAVKKLLPVFRASIPPSVNIDILADRSLSVRQSVADVEATLGLTTVLVVLVIFLFLRKASATLIPTLALPVSIVGTFAGMVLFGFSLDNISLMALTLAVGFVVDDAIVMLEDIVRHIEEGEQPFRAALKGSKEIGFTILSITFSLCAVFIPVLFMGGVVRRIFREFAVTISMAILVSGFVSLTLTPMMCSRFLRHHDASEENIFGRFLEGCFQLLLSGYDRSLRVVLKYRFPTLLVLFATMAGSAYLFQSIPKGFFPTEDTGFITGKTEGQQGSGFGAMVELQQRAAAIVAADPAVEMVFDSVGQSGITQTLNTGSLFIGLKPLDQRPPVQQVIQRLRGKLQGIPGLNVFMQPVQSMNIGGRPSKSQYQYTLQAGDLTELYKWADTMKERVAKLPGVQDVTTDMQIATPNERLAIDMDRAQSLGIDNTTLRDTLFSSFGTRQVADIYSAFSDTPVILEVDPKYQENADGLKHIYVRSSIPTANTGKLVPLDGFVSFRQSVGPSSVSHQGQLPSVTISFNLEPGVALGQAVDGIAEIERQVAMPATVTTSFQGSAQVFQQATAGQAMLLATAVAVIYIILGVLYESFIHPITILTGLPSAALGALLTLQLFHMDLSVIAMIGIVMLIGIVKKNAIMMIDFALQQKQAGESDPVKAMYQACIMRFRPIMMTSFACIFGTLPIALGAGAGSELRRPLGVAVVGWLIVSQVLTLDITPVVFIYFERLLAYMRIGTRRPDETPAMHGSPAE